MAPTVATRTAQIQPGAPRGDARLSLVIGGRDYKKIDMKWLKGRLKDMDSTRQEWLPQWREIADFIAPRRSHYLRKKAADGRKRNQKILNSKATRSVRRAVAGFQSGMTPRTRPWFMFETEATRSRRDTSFDDRAWADDARSVVSSVLQRSNFYAATQLVYEDAVPFGTGCMQIDEIDGPELINCVVHPIGSYFLDTNDRGQIDTFARCYTWTLKQIINRFGRSSLSRTLQEQAKHSIGSKVDIWNCIYPNEDFEEGKVGIPGKRWISCWWVTGEEDTHGPIHVDGYFEFPIFALRFWRVAEEPWGQSPGMDALPDVKSLQKETSLKMLGIEKGVLPSLKGPGSKKDAPSQMPGSYTAVSNPESITNLEDTSFELAAVFQDIELLKADIADTFFEPLFTAIMDTARRQRTLGEVEKIESEKYSMLGPVLENIIDDMLEPAITRVYNISERRNRIPDPPETLAEEPVQIAFVSILAQAQKALEAVGVEQLMTFAASLSEQFPDMRLRIDQNIAIERYAEAVAASSVLRSREDAEADAQAEAAAQQQAQQMAMLESMAKSAKDASQATTDQPSALSMIADQFAGGRA